MIFIGFDIGGTKSRVAISNELDVKYTVHLEQDNTAENQVVRPALIKSALYNTKEYARAELISLMVQDTVILCNQYSLDLSQAYFGISCGGPLDAQVGTVLAAPNLPTWENFAIVDYVKEQLRLATKLTFPNVYLCNDANASALAEYFWGVGPKYKNMAFLTFGTGLGAGLILNGRLYEGATGNAGEIGHIRLADEGVLAYGKTGSFESFCSGYGISQMILAKKKKLLEDSAVLPSWMKSENPSAKDLFSAYDSCELSRELVHRIAERLGQGLSIILDILDLDCVVIGSIYQRNEARIFPILNKVLAKEILSMIYQNVQIKASVLAEDIGNYAALAVAYYYYKKSPDYLV